MKNSKERQTSKVVTVESGVCEKIQSSIVKKNTFKAFTYNSFGSRNKVFEQVDYFI